MEWILGIIMKYITGVHNWAERDGGCGFERTIRKRWKCGITYTWIIGWKMENHDRITVKMEKFMGKK